MNQLCFQQFRNSRCDAGDKQKPYKHADAFMYNVCASVLPPFLSTHSLACPPNPLILKPACAPGPAPGTPSHPLTDSTTYFQEHTCLRVCLFPPDFLTCLRPCFLAFSLTCTLARVRACVLAGLLACWRALLALFACLLACSLALLLFLTYLLHC